MGKREKTHVLFVQRAIPDYRLPFFKALALQEEFLLTLLLLDSNEQGNYEGCLTQAELRAEGIHCNVVKGKGMRILGKTIIWYPQLLYYLYSHRVDAVIVGGGLIFWAFPLIDVLIFSCLHIFRGLRFIFGLSSLSNESTKLIMRFAKRAYFRCQSIYANSFVVYGDRTKDALIQRGILASKVFVAYNSLDTKHLLEIKSKLLKNTDWQHELLNELRLENKNKIILSLARIRRKKRIDLLIDAFPKISELHSEAVLVIVGNGDIVNDLKKQAFSKGVSKRVIFRPGVYDDEVVAKYFLLSDVVVFPGWISLATQFAMCMGKPIVCAPYGNELEYVINGENGFLFDPGNIEDLADKVIQLLEHPELSFKFAEKSADIIKNKVNLQGKIAGYVNAIKYTYREKH